MMPQIGGKFQPGMFLTQNCDCQPEISGKDHWDANFKSAFGIGCLDLLYAVFILPESLPKENRPAFSMDALNPFAP